MPKERKASSHPAMVSPYARSPKISDQKIPEVSPPVGDTKEWEETRCPICLDHPHNAVLLVCSSKEKGCRPFICDTSNRLSNCLDQFRKSSEKQRSYLVCPLCRGLLTEWVTEEPARKFMNSKIRSCSLETCDFSGNYAELRKHARQKHPSDRPSEISSTRNSNWRSLMRQMDLDDALAHQLGEMDWEQDDLLSDESFFDFSSGMSDFDFDPLSDSDFQVENGGLVSPSLELPSLDFFDPTVIEWDMLSSRSSRSRSRNDERNLFTSFVAGLSNRRSSYEREIGGTNLSPRTSPRASTRRENGQPRSRRTATRRSQR